MFGTADAEPKHDAGHDALIPGEIIRHGERG
jgi:hypothetical protein